MATLDTLKTLFLDLSIEDRTQLVAAMRESRRTSKKPVVEARAKRTATPKKTKRETTLDALKEQLSTFLSTLSAEECLAILLDTDPTLTPEDAFAFLTDIGVEV